MAKNSADNDALFLKYEYEIPKQEKKRPPADAETFEGQGTITRNDHTKATITVLGSDRLLYYFEYPNKSTAYKSYEVGDFVIFYYNKQDLDCFVTSLNRGS